MEKKPILEKISNIFFATGVATLIVLINMVILNSLIPHWGMKLVDPTMSWQAVVRGIFLAPLVEEFVFRWLPLTLALKVAFFKEDKENLYILVAFLACIFGYIHGSFYNILIQGVAGFFFGWVYIKNGMSYWSAAATHFLYNFVCLVIFPALIK